jgi:hypothetical protein
MSAYIFNVSITVTSVADTSKNAISNIRDSLAMIPGIAPNDISIVPVWDNTRASLHKAIYDGLTLYIHNTAKKECNPIAMDNFNRVNSLISFCNEWNIDISNLSKLIAQAYKYSDSFDLFWLSNNAISVKIELESLLDLIAPESYYFNRVTYSFDKSKPLSFNGDHYIICDSCKPFDILFCCACFCDTHGIAKPKISMPIEAKINPKHSFYKSSQAEDIITAYYNIFRTACPNGYHFGLHDYDVGLLGFWSDI